MLFAALADRFNYTPEEISELTIDQAFILLNDGKDPGKKVITLHRGDDVSKALAKIRS